MDAISALMDGELDADEARRQLSKVKEDRTLRTRWDDYHLIGDAMRGETALSPRFDEILARRLAAEPTVLAPRRFPSRRNRLSTYAMSAAASLGAVAFVGWMALGPTGIAVSDSSKGLTGATAPTNIAGTGMPPPSPLPEANVPSDGRMNEYLLAHQGFSPSTALQGIGPYIRSVSTTAQITGR
jgi:sigma-E factor negative regulatory protein RseA